FDIASFESSNTALVTWTDTSGVQAAIVSPEAAMPGSTPGFVTDVGPVNVASGGRAPEVVYTCADRALLVAEVANAGGAAIDAVFLDPATLDADQRITSPIPGTRPRLVLDPAGGVMAGALVSPMPPALGPNGRPATAEVVCDP